MVGELAWSTATDAFLATAEAYGLSTNMKNALGVALLKGADMQFDGLYFFLVYRRIVSLFAVIMNRLLSRW